MQPQGEGKLGRAQREGRGDGKTSGAGLSDMVGLDLLRSESLIFKVNQKNGEPPKSST